MTCEEYRALLDRLLDGEVTPAEEEELRRHEAECPDCAALRAEMTGLMDLLRDAEDVPPMPENLHAEWMKAVRAETPDAPEASEASEKTGKEKILSMAAFRRQWMRWGATAALALLVLGGTLLTWDSFDKAKVRTPRAAQATMTATVAEKTELPEAALALGADDPVMTAEEAEEVEEEPMEAAEVYAETADSAAFEEAPMLAVELRDEYAPAESAEEETLWEMDEAYEEDAAWEANGALGMQSYAMETPMIQSKAAEMPMPAYTALPTSTPAPALTPAPTLTPSPTPSPTPESTPEPVPEPVDETAETEEEPEPESETSEESRPKQWIGWIALGVGGVLALVVLGTKQFREWRKHKKP